MYLIMFEVQSSLDLRRWGGLRKGAGRKHNERLRAKTPHRKRERFNSELPVHCTWRILPNICNMRSNNIFEVVLSALLGGAEQRGFRLLEFTVQGVHIHCLVEAANHEALSRGCQSLGIRMAKAINKCMERTGPLFEQRFHSRVLHSRAEVLNVRGYIRNNRLHHLTEAGFTVPPRFVDECSSYALSGTITLPQPQSWLVLIAIGRPDLYRCKRKVAPSPQLNLLKRAA